MWLESRLIKKAKKDPDAFTELYRSHVQATYGFIAFRVNDKALAEDLTSDLWMKVLKHLPNLESNEAAVFKAWLFTMAKNLLVDEYRKLGQRTFELTEEMAEELGEEFHPVDHDFHSKIRKMVKDLPEKQAEVVSLRYFSDLKNHEIAKLLQISEKTVASNLSRALAKLKQSLNPLMQ